MAPSVRRDLSHHQRRLRRPHLWHRVAHLLLNRLSDLAAPPHRHSLLDHVSLEGPGDRVCQLLQLFHAVLRHRARREHQPRLVARGFRLSRQHQVGQGGLLRLAVSVVLEHPISYEVLQPGHPNYLEARARGQ